MGETDCSAYPVPSGAWRSLGIVARPDFPRSIVEFQHRFPDVGDGHRTRTPLPLWFWAAYLVSTHTPGMSAVQLQRQLGISRYGDEHVLPRAHRAISKLKTWLRGTHRGVSNKHLQVYLDEFVFRFNRRGTPMAAFQTLLGLSSQHQPTTYRQIVA